MYSIEQIRRAGLTGEISSIDVEHLISEGKISDFPLLSSPKIKFKDDTILINGFETYLYDEDNVYSLGGDTLYTAQEFCEKYNYNNTCEGCNDIGSYVDDVFVGCTRPMSECCGGCTEVMLVDCECEDKKFKTWD